MKVWNLNYPSIGKRNEWAQAIRSFDAHTDKVEELLDFGSTVLKQRWGTQHDLGVDSIPLNDFSFFDTVLETAYLFNLIPDTVEPSEHWFLDLKKMSSAMPLARWFHTPYQYFAPEWNPKKGLRLNTQRMDWELSVQKALPYTFHFSILGPWTLAQLCRTGTRSKSDLVTELIPQYVELMKLLKKKGLSWIQIEEPSLCGNVEKKDIQLVETAYERMATPQLKIMLSTFYDSPDPWLSELSRLPVEGLHFDVVAGPAVLSWIKTRSFPKDKILCLGIVNSLNIWRSSLSNLVKQLELLQGFHQGNKIFLAPSGPLFHLPLCREEEEQLKNEPMVFENLSFANQRLEELDRLKKVLQGAEKVEELSKEESVREAHLKKFQKPLDSVRNQLNRTDFTFRKRTSSITKRNKLQQKRLGLPLIPVTQNGPIGTPSVIPHFEPCPDVSFWETLSVNEKIYQLAGSWEGFRRTEWGYIKVQGMNCVRPAIIISDIDWKETGAIQEFAQAVGKDKSLQKGRSIGPLTLVSTSFVRPDLSIEQIGAQAALAVRKEIQKLEAVGARIIQVDEPALGVGLPLKRQKHSLFWKTCLDIFKLAASGVKDETQTHLNIEWSGLENTKELLEKCDVDVISFYVDERSEDGFSWLKMHPLECGLAPGYFETKPNDLTTEKSVEKFMRRAFEVVAPDKLWITSAALMDSRNTDEQIQVLQKIINVTHLIRKLIKNT